MIDWGNAAKAYFDEMPHPKAPSLKIKYFATAVKLASLLKFGGHAEAHEAALFWREYAPNNVPIMAPQELEKAIDHIAPLTYAFHGRPPSLDELVKFKDEAPHLVRKHFADLPDVHYPTVPAGDMVRILHSANEHAQRAFGRQALKNEAADMYHSGEKPESFYTRLASQSAQPRMQSASDVQTPLGRNPGRRGLASLGGSPTGQRTPFG